MTTPSIASGIEAKLEKHRTPSTSEAAGLTGGSLVARIAKLAEDGVGSLSAASGHASDGNALPTEKISYRIWN
jgi:hypothetical protein